MDYTKPSTWLSAFRSPIRQELPFSADAALQVSEEAYASVARVRPIILALVEADVSRDVYSDELGVSDLLLPVIHDLSSKRVVEKLTEFHELRYMMCQTASELCKPPSMYQEDKAPVLYMRAPSVEEFEPSQVQDVLIVMRRVMTELKIILACMEEAEVYLAVRGKERHLRKYIWRSASLAVAIAQCLQMIAAYYTFLSSERALGSKFVGVAAIDSEVSPDAEVIFASRIHA